MKTRLMGRTMENDPIRVVDVSKPLITKIYYIDDFTHCSAFHTPEIDVLEPSCQGPVTSTLGSLRSFGGCYNENLTLK